jgi:hypothetical protein
LLAYTSKFWDEYFTSVFLLGKYSLVALNSTHSRLPENKIDECQFCEKIATMMICNLSHEPTFLLCDTHCLLFITGLLQDITSTKGSAAVKQLIGEKQEQEKKDRQALHIK